MQVSTSVQRWIAVLMALTIVLIGGVVTSAQTSDPIVRFFGFSGDVTIDGGPVEPGTVIVAMVGDEEVGRTTVNQAGAWILDVNSADLPGDSCGVTFVVDGLRAPEEWGLRGAEAAARPGRRRSGARLLQSLNGFTGRERAGRSSVPRPRRSGRGERLSGEC